MAYYHGTFAALPLGTILTPGGPGGRIHNWDYGHHDIPAEYADYVWMTDNPDTAEGWATHPPGSLDQPRFLGDPFVYEVEPLGRVRKQCEWGSCLYNAESARVVAVILQPTSVRIDDEWMDMDPVFALRRWARRRLR